MGNLDDDKLFFYNISPEGTHINYDNISYLDVSKDDTSSLSCTGFAYSNIYLYGGCYDRKASASAPGNLHIYSLTTDKHS